MALVVFGALFIALFAIFAVAQGIGQPSVPSGDVALVKGSPAGHISEAEYRRAFVSQSARGGLKRPPKPSSKKYEELKKAALEELIESAWIRGEAEEEGITVTKKQIATELANIKKQEFPTKKAFAEFLKSSHLTPREVNGIVELRILTQEIQQGISGEAPAVSQGEVADYYDAAKAEQFTTKPSRDVRVIVNKNKKKVEEAQTELEKDNSPASWKKVAPKFSSDPTTKAKGGLQKEISEELLQGALKTAIFGSATGELVGPVEYQKNYFLVEVVALHPEKTKSLSEVKSQISTQLTQQKQQEFITEFVSAFTSKWTSRTFCAAGYLIEKCANFRGSGHPASAPEACYEANPKTPVSECPAPVEQTKPALPGTVTVLKPKGEQFVQRPRPESSGAAAGAAAEALEGAPPTTAE